MEILDICDEFGNPTGKVEDREIIHQEGLLHRTAHVWLLRKKNNQIEILLQKRSDAKDSFPGCYDISSAGHIPAGDGYFKSAKRELKEELNLDVKPEELQFIKTLKRSSKYTATFINNEFDDLYILRTNKKIEDMKFQKEEISEIFFVPYKKFKEMVNNKQPDLLMHTEEFEILFNMFDNEFGR